MTVRLLIISSSPRPYGYTRSIAKFVARVARELENAEAKVIDVFDYDIKPCQGCVSDNVKLCSWPCPIDDDMHALYKMVEESDGIIFVTPIYWYNIPGPLKTFIDRITLFENAIFVEGRSRLEGKVAGFIAIGNDTGAIALIQNLMVVMNSMGMVIPPWALAYHHSEDIPFDNHKLILDAANVAHCAVLMIRALRGEERPTTWYRADDEYRDKVLKIAREVEEEALRELTL